MPKKTLNDYKVISLLDGQVEGLPEITKNNTHHYF